jgi:3-phenylpropionate/trans-cinnamate dioxygenase ferredoxin subunit
MGNGTFLARVSDVPEGTMRVVSIDGEAVLLVHTHERLAAVSATCTHEGESLGEGYLTDTSIICAYHGSEFDLVSGDVIEPPAERPLTVHALVIVGDEIYLAEAAP